MKNVFLSQYCVPKCLVCIGIKIITFDPIKQIQQNEQNKLKLSLRDYNKFV